MVSQNQAKLFIEQKKIPFPVDNHNINEELGKSTLYWQLKPNLPSDRSPFFFFTPAIGYVLIGNGLYDEAIKHFSLLLQVRLSYIYIYGERGLIDPNALLKVGVCDAGGPRAGQRHLRARDSLREEEPAGERAN